MLKLNKGDIFDGKYELEEFLAEGGFAQVWKAKYLEVGNTVALKIYPNLDAEGLSTILSEYNIDLQHTHLVKILHCSKSDGYAYLVMRYYVGGNASKLIGVMDEKEMGKCIAQIAGALELLHKNDYVHKDIKPNNFLLDNEGNYYLADLGLSIKIKATIQRQTQKKGESHVGQAGVTPMLYRAPELCVAGNSNSAPIKASDIWALGASIFEMAKTVPPFGELGGYMQLNGQSVPDLDKDFSTDANYIIRKCLAKDPWDRPTASQLKNWADNYNETGKWGVNKKSKVATLVVSLAAVVIVSLSAWYFLHAGNQGGKQKVKITTTESYKSNLDVQSIPEGSTTNKQNKIGRIEESNAGKVVDMDEPHKAIKGIRTENPNYTPLTIKCPPKVVSVTKRDNDLLVEFEFSDCNIHILDERHPVFYIAIADQKNINMIGSLSRKDNIVQARFGKLGNSVKKIHIYENGRGRDLLRFRDIIIN